MIKAEHVGGDATVQSGVFTGSGDQIPNQLGGDGIAASVDDEARVIGGEGYPVAEIVAHQMGE
nr:MAG: hypothetical protein BECKFW1821A_GA0114235_100264 [Candidatus Kentron sp. FW]